MTLPSAGALVTPLGTFLVGSVLYIVTAHLAAIYVLGDVPAWHAVLVGPVPAAITVGVGWFSPELAAPLAIAGDFLAIRGSYDLDRRTAAWVTAAHVVLSVLLTVSVVGLLGSFGIGAA